MKKKPIIISFVLILCSFGLLFFGNCKVDPVEEETNLTADETRTLNSLEKVNNLYTMTYYANYNDLLERKNREHGSGAKLSKKFGCSLISASGNPEQPIYGRNFDNPNCGVLMVRYFPKDGYSSIGFTRLNDCGISYDTDPTTLSLSQRERLLESAFYVPDGMNERGVSVALASVEGQTVKIDENKRTIFVTCWIREILDHAQNLNEAVLIATNFNVFDQVRNILSHHILIADSSGRSAIVEYDRGEWRVIPNIEPWQIVTNSPLYNVPVDKVDCWRFASGYNQLKELKGIASRTETMDILMSLANNTPWSWVGDMKKKEIDVVLYKNEHQKLTFKVESLPSTD